MAQRHGVRESDLAAEARAADTDTKHGAPLLYRGGKTRRRRSSSTSFWARRFVHSTCVPHVRNHMCPHGVNTEHGAEGHRRAQPKLSAAYLSVNLACVAKARAQTLDRHCAKKKAPGTCIQRRQMGSSAWLSKHQPIQNGVQTVGPLSGPTSRGKRGGTDSR
jgi:hypothetical protein